MEGKDGQGDERVFCNVMSVLVVHSGNMAPSLTMKVQSCSCRHPILLLINSGAGHSFITAKLMASLGSFTTRTKEFEVGLGNGRNFDLILGMEWVKTLGETKTDWTTKTMSFSQDGGVVTFKGNCMGDQHHSSHATSFTNNWI